MIKDFDLSDKKVMNILARMKGIFGSECFTPGIRESLIDRKKQVKKYFKREEMLFEVGEDEYEKRQLIYTEDLDVLLDFICFERGIEKIQQNQRWA